FRLDSHGDPIGAEGEIVALPSAGSVRVLHPATLTPSALQAWQSHQQAYQLAQPFLQLARPVAAPQGAARVARICTTYQGYVIYPSLLERLVKAGWRGAHHAMVKHFPDFGIQALLETGALGPHLSQLSQMLGGLFF